MDFPQYLYYKKERTYSIEGYIGQVETYIDNKGYIDKDTGSIYICSKDLKPYHNDVPILYANGNNIKKVDANAPGIISTFKAKNLKSLSYKHILDTTKEDDQLYDENALADMNAATKVYTPTIRDEDDPLKRLIKQTIISKSIDINRLKHRMPEKYGLTNLKSALEGKTKMSISNFNVWCELLGINYEVIITDNGSDTKNPLRKAVIYSNSTNRIVEG